MTIPEHVRDELERLSDNGRQFHFAFYRDLLVVAEWAVENFLNSDDDEPVTEEWLRENGFDVEPHHNFGWEARRVFIETPFHDEVLVIRPDEAFLELGKDYWSSVIDCETRGQVRKLLEALKGE